MNTHLYLPSQGRYATTIYQGRTITPSIHAQAWPLAYGVVPDGNVDDVAKSLLELLPDTVDFNSPEVGIYGMFWVLEALGQAGRVTEAVDIIEAYYGSLLDLGATTWWEDFNAHEKYSASLSHGWGAAPTWFLTTHVLGARRTGPDSWTVQPSLRGLQQATGALPLEDDVLRIDWERQGCGESLLGVTAPPGTVGELVFPCVEGTTTLTLNDQLIWSDGEPVVEDVGETADGVRVPLEGGTHTLRLLEDCDTVSPSTY
jgi:alpha-L-rhamnosidase